MKKIFEDFKQFAMRGNVIDLAVGVIVGGAFGKIVSSVVSDVIMPPLGLLVGGVNFTDLKIVLKKAGVAADGSAAPAVTLNYGNCIQNLFDFLIVAFVVFLVIRVINRLTAKQEDRVEAEPPTPSEEVRLLTQIRDLLNKEEKK